MLVKLDHFPKDQGENKKYLKPPPRYVGDYIYYPGFFWIITNHELRIPIKQPGFNGRYPRMFQLGGRTKTLQTSDLPHPSAGPLETREDMEVLRLRNFKVGTGYSPKMVKLCEKGDLGPTKKSFEKNHIFGNLHVLPTMK